MIEWSVPKQTRICGEVVSRSGRRHQVLADDGRMLLVDSDTPYVQGARVTVIADSITGISGKAPVVRSYQE